MPSIEIKQLFNYNRFPEPSAQLLTFLLYIPLGTILLLLRILIALVFGFLTAILPNVPFVHNILHRLLNIAFGIVVQVENLEKKEDVETYISNKVSVFDASVVNFITNSVMPSVEFSSLLSAILGVHNFGSTTNVDELRRSIESYVTEKKVPLLFQPEMLATNGKGLLKFSNSPFILYNKVQPITLSVYRPVIDISISTISSQFWSDLLWYMFVPCTVYKLRFLPAVEKKGVAEVEYANRIRQNIANDLKVDLTNFLVNDMKEFKKRYLIEQQRSNIAQRSQTSVNPELHQMTLQVREVLPLVPYNVVYRDLSKTRSVDITITNILEGYVQYTPEQPKPSSSAMTLNHSSIPNVSASSQSSSRTPLNSCASSFSKSPQQRALSFQERKKQLVDNARRKYIEKHGLNIPDS